MAACGAVGRGFESLWAHTENNMNPASNSSVWLFGLMKMTPIDSFQSAQNPYIGSNTIHKPFGLVSSSFLRLRGVIKIQATQQSIKSVKCKMHQNVLSQSCSKRSIGADNRNYDNRNPIYCATSPNGGRAKDMAVQKSRWLCLGLHSWENHIHFWNDSKNGRKEITHSRRTKGNYADYI